MHLQTSSRPCLLKLLLQVLEFPNDVRQLALAIVVEERCPIRLELIGWSLPPIRFPKTVPFLTEPFRDVLEGPLQHPLDVIGDMSRFATATTCCGVEAHEQNE